MRAHLILRKTVADLSNPKLLVAYLVPFLLVGGFLGLAFANGEISDNVANLPLAEQEAELFATFLAFSFIWGTGAPVLALGSVFGAYTLATAAENGTLRILLSKPIRRWEVLLGTLGGIVVYLWLVALASMLLAATMLHALAETSAAALGEGVFRAAPANLLYALFVAFVMGAIGVSLSVFTTDRLRTGLLALPVALLYVMGLPIRIFSGSRYEEYYLWIVDLNYQFGNAFVAIHEAVGGQLSPETQHAVGLWTGVYDFVAADEVPAEPVDPVGYVSPEVSLVALCLLSAGLVVAAAYRFHRMDI